MKTRALALLLGLGLCFLAGSRPGQAQPSTPAVSAEKRNDFEATFKKLKLTPRQRLTMAKILQDAKASGQDRVTTAGLIEKELTPEQKKILLEDLRAQSAAKKTATP